MARLNFWFRKVTPLNVYGPLGGIGPNDLGT